MTRGLRFLDPEDSKAREAWDTAVWASPVGTVFHTTAWMDAVRKGIGFEPRFAYLPACDGSFRALVPLFHAGGFWRSVRWLNIPQSCPSDPVASSVSEAESLLEAVASAAATQGARAVVLRTARDLRPAVPEGWEVRRENPLLRHVLDLRGARDIQTLPRLRRRHRRGYRNMQQKLSSRGLQVRLVGPGEAPAFARVAHRVLLRRHGHLGLPARFFETLVEVLPGAARLAVIGPAPDTPLAFVVSLWSPTYSHMLYGSGIPTAEGIEAYRLGLGMEIEAAIQGGLQSVDLGETSPEQSGLILFKEGWGSEQVDGSYLVLARKGAASGLRVGGGRVAWATQWLRYLPVSLSLKIAGPIHRSLQ